MQWRPAAASDHCCRPHYTLSPPLLLKQMGRQGRQDRGGEGEMEQTNIPFESDNGAGRAQNGTLMGDWVQEDTTGIGGFGGSNGC